MTHGGNRSHKKGVSGVLTAEISPMNIPEHVKKLAKDAVSHHETMQHVRWMEGNGSGPQFTPLENQGPGEVKPYQPITPDVMRQAKDAVSHRETMAHVRQLEMTGSIAPMYTPSFHSQRIAERIAEMQRQGVHQASINRAMTKDNFERDI